AAARLAEPGGRRGDGGDVPDARRLRRLPRIALAARLAGTPRRVRSSARLRARDRRPPRPPPRLVTETLLLVGTSHRFAPVELRERVALDREAAAELSRRLGQA